MISSGIRVSAWEELRWKHVTPIFDYTGTQIIAARLLVYPGDKEKYYTFNTPEAYNSINE